MPTAQLGRGKDKPRGAKRRNARWLAGIDVSMYQCNIDWQRVAASQKKFVFIKATEGASFVDPFFQYNWQSARAVGMIRGAYHYFRPQQPVEQQVSNFVAAVGRLEHNDLPPVLDLEVPEQWAPIEMSKRVGLVLAWLNGVEKALGVAPIIYLSPNFVRNVLGTQYAEPLKRYHLWIANYTNAPEPIVPSPWTAWTFWQHSDKGTVDGITCNVVDLDWFAGSVRLLKQLTVKIKRKTRTGKRAIRSNRSAPGSSR
jgi:lysozyme